MKGKRALDVKKSSDVDIVVVTNNVLPSLQYIHFHCLSCTFSVFSLCNMAHQSLTRRRCYKPPRVMTTYLPHEDRLCSAGTLQYRKTICWQTPPFGRKLTDTSLSAHFSVLSLVHTHFLQFATSCYNISDNVLNVWRNIGCLHI